MFQTETPSFVSELKYKQGVILKINYLNLHSHSCFGIYSHRLLIFPAKVTSLHMRSSFYQSTRGPYQSSEPKIRSVIGNLIYCRVFFHQGATIRRDEATGAVIVARIMRGGAADRSGETNSVHTNIIIIKVKCISKV